MPAFSGGGSIGSSGKRPFDRAMRFSIGGVADLPKSYLQQVQVHRLDKKFGGSQSVARRPHSSSP
jgi:hypothetical protein